MITCKNLSFAYGTGQRMMLDDVSFEVASGTLCGIIGPNGAGKTTLLKLITGILMPTQGQIIIDGKKLVSYNRKQIAQILAVVPQSTYVPTLYTVEDVVAMGRYPHQKSRFFYSSEDRRIIQEALAETGASAFCGRLVSQLSGGERQEVIISRALAQQPKILLLDEPIANLDIRHQLKILGLVRDLVAVKKITAVIVIHDLNLAARFCDNLVLIHNSKVFAQGTAREVLTEESIRLTYQVLAKVGHCDATASLAVTALSALQESKSNLSQKERL